MKESKALFGATLLILVILNLLLFSVWFEIINPQLILGLVVGLIPSFITIHQKKKDREEDYKNWLMRNKEACAIELVDTFLSSVTRYNHLSEVEKQKRMLERIRHVLPALIVWGTPRLIRQWEAIVTSHDKGTEAEKLCGIVRRGERFLRCIRKDLGHNDQKLRPGALWASLVKPVEKEEVYRACEGENYTNL